MGLFSGDAPERSIDIKAIPVIPYEILLADGKWHHVDAHNADIVEGCLVVANLVYMNPAGTVTRSMPHFFAPGEWRQCKSDYEGCEKSSLTI